MPILDGLWKNALHLMNFTLFVLLFLFTSAAQAQNKVILFLGDSITAGYGVKLEDSFPSLIETQLKTDKNPIQVINGGESGALSAQMKPRLEWFLKKTKPNLIVLIAGGNDARQMVPAEKIEKNLKEVIQLAEKNNIPVILGGMQIFTNYGEKYTKQFAELYPRLAKLAKVTLVPFILEGVAAKKEMNQYDGFHPNPDGHKVIAQNLLPFIRRQL